MKNEHHFEADVIIIGAGPSGSIAAAQLCQKGYDVVVLEKQHFPRFSIGESLLPQCMSFIESSGMLPAVEEANFQFKNGAAFRLGDQYTEFDFTEKFSPGWGTTFQVQRGKFDHILAQQAEQCGARMFYGHEITAVNTGKQAHLTGLDRSGRESHSQSQVYSGCERFWPSTAPPLGLGIALKLPCSTIIVYPY